MAMWACTNQKKDKFPNLSSEAFEEFISNKNVQILDVRTAAEYAEGHIEGSKNIDIYNPDFAEIAAKELDPSRPVAIYCKSGRRSRNAANILADKGFKIYNLDKGITGWIEDGMAVVTD